MNVGGNGQGGNLMQMNMQPMYGQQQSQQSVQPNQQQLMNAIGGPRMILQANRMAVQ